MHNGGAAENPHRGAAPPWPTSNDTSSSARTPVRRAASRPAGPAASAAIATALQEGLGRHPELWGRIAVTSTGCLGPCFEGPTVVVYPEAVWYVGVTVDDVPEIVESHMRHGVPVARLVRTTED